MNRKLKPIGYSIAVVSAALGIAVRFPLWSLLGASIPYMTFFPAILVSAWYGGLGPGILCTILSALAAVWFLVHPSAVLPGSGVPEGIGLVLFMSTGAFISWATQRLHDAQAMERRLRTMSEQTLASIGDAVIACGVDRRITFMNENALALTGWTQATAYGRQISEVFRIGLPSGDSPDLSSIERAFITGTTQKSSAPVQLAGKDQPSIEIDQTAAPIRAANGEVIGAVLVFRDVSLQRQAQTALLESREQLRITLESITDAFMALDRDWRFTYLNAEAERSLGRAREVLVGRNHWEEYPEMKGTVLEDQYSLAMKERKPVAFEIFSKRSSRWLEVNAFPAGDGGISIYFRDITARKGADAALAQSRSETERARDLLQTTLASIGDGVIATDTETRVTFLNDVAASMIGLEAKAAIGKRLTEIFIIVNEDTHEPVENPALRALHEGIIVGLANHTILKSLDGRETPIDDSAAPIRNAEGSIIGSVLVFRDVAGRRSAEKALKESEERLRLALRIGKIGVWDWDIPTNRISWSERVFEMHGVDPGQFGGRVEDLLPLVHPDDRDRLTRAVRGAIEHSDPYHIQIRAVHPDGKTVWLETTGDVIRDANGNAARMLGATTDITERKKVEAEMRLQARELHRSNSDLERFAFAASHDLQEPLRMITIYTQLLSRRMPEGLDEDSAKYIEIVLDGTKRMRTLIQDLLAYAQVAHEKRTFQPVDAHVAVTRVLQVCEPLMKESGATVECCRLPIVRVQESHLEQIFQNLVVNAIRYRSADSPRIRIWAEENETELTFSVQDNGLGIAPHQRERVFELFKRLDAKSKGTGIGLALCQRIIEGYGGRIWVESELSRGSTFRFTLPRNPEDVQTGGS